MKKEEENIKMNLNEYMKMIYTGSIGATECNQDLHFVFVLANLVVPHILLVVFIVTVYIRSHTVHTARMHGSKLFSITNAKVCTSLAV